MSRALPVGQGRRRLLIRSLPLLLLAGGAFALGASLGSSSPARQAVERFAEGWTAQDFGAMHAELSREAARAHPLDSFRDVYRSAQEAATVTGIGTGEVDDAGEVADAELVSLRVAFATRLFGELGGAIEMPVSDDGIEWAPHLVFPGLEPGQALAGRIGRVPRRAPILARDRTPLAEGPDRSSPIGTAASHVTGEVAAPSDEVSEQLEQRGFPPDTPVGVSGLELAFEERLAGEPGGRLVVVDSSTLGSQRTIARSRAEPADPLRTTIDPALQGAAVAALGDRLGGVAVLDAESGRVRALAGLAFSAPQPPGSVFKIVTATAALEEDVTRAGEEFPVLVSADAGGRELSNAHDEACGGTLVESFARSCNTVFGPLGVELGADELVEYAEKFGFNSRPRLYNDEATAVIDPAASTIPDPIESTVELGVSAIGQGRILATPLQMASVAQAIANDGVLTATPIVTEDALEPDGRSRRVASRRTANLLETMMVAVVREGTGVPAALTSVEVAGKTGTAELHPKPPEPGEELPPDAEPEFEVDAWFAAFAPAARPELALAVMVVNADGDGGEVAGPIARSILAARFGE